MKKFIEELIEAVKRWARPTAAAGACAGIVLGTLATQPAHALDSFGMTNVINQGVTIVNWPTNSPSTNFVISGYTTNGAVITTNGYYPTQWTGKAIEVDNYNDVGFVFKGVVIATNSGSIVFQLVRSDQPAPSIPGTNYLTQIFPTLPFGDLPFETTPSFTVTVPYTVLNNATLQTNFIYYITNLPNTYVQSCRSIGIYSATNSNLPDAVNAPSVTNAVAGLIRNIIPVSLSGGNF